MKREVSRARKIPAFKMALADLGALLVRLTPLFDGGKFSPTITISLKNEELRFESFEELSAFTGLPTQITSFRVWINAGDKTLSLYSSGFMSGASVSASADNEAWCAGAVEVVWQFLQPYRLWYGWFRGWPLNITALISPNFPLILYILGVIPVTQSPLFWGAWLTACVVLGALYLWKNRLLPPAVLQVSTEESSLRRHLPELTLLVAIVSLVFTIVGWFVGKNA
jgi:hypothetical protein